MAEIHLTEAELARDLHAVLERVRRGAEVVVEHEHEPIAVLKAMESPHRTAREILALIPKDSTATMDADFANDIEAARESHREPLDASKWD